jgi:hypothetical protein
VGAAPYRVKTKILNTYGLLYGKELAMAHGFNAKNQSDPSGSRYKRKCDCLLWHKPNRHIFAYNSSWGGPINLIFPPLKPCAIAGSFPYNNPYVFKILIFTLQGAAPTTGFFSSPKTHSHLEF